MTSKSTKSTMSESRTRLIIERLRPQVAQIFGYNALLYTPLAKALCSPELRIKNQLVIGQEGRALNVKCRFEELPIAPDCIDLAVLPNTLQQSEFPHQILREVERVLIPEGVVIVIGRNPISWQGIKNLIRQKRSQTAKLNRDISRRRIADWFRLLGFETETEINVSVTNNRLQNSQAYGWVKSLGQTFCDWFCSYYIIIGRKKMSTLTPIRPSWRSNKQLVPSRVAEPSVRAQVEHWFEQLK